MLPISEIFYSIQGEGINIGKPSIFIRLYYCNLYCSWCDTKYTWENQAKAIENVDYFMMDEKEIIEKIKKFNSKNIVITGGEPLLHQTKLINLLKGLDDYFIEIETNGTIIPKQELIDLIDLFTVSPKLSNSDVKYEHRIRKDAIFFFSKLDKSIFKFVIKKEEDIEEVISLAKDFGISNDKIILMPEGIDEESIISRSRWLIELCKVHNFRYSPRMHIILWGNKRGF